MKQIKLDKQLVINGKEIHGILFDMDGTMIDSTHAVESSWRRWSERTGISYEKIMETSHGRPTRETIEIMAPHLYADIEAEWMLQHEMTDNDGNLPVAGIHQFLESLNIPWTVVTSAGETIARHRFELAKIDVPAEIVTIEKVKKGKPDPEPYLLGAKLIGVPIENCLVFEDTPIGIAAGTKAGAQVVAVTTTFPITYFPDNFTITDYNEFMKVI